MYMNKCDNEQDRYLDLKALAEYSSISVRTLRDYLTDPSNPIPAYQIKRKVLVKKSEFDSWIETHRTEPGRVDRIVDEVLKDFFIKKPKKK